MNSKALHTAATVAVTIIMVGCVRYDAGVLSVKSNDVQFIRSSGGSLTYCVDKNVVSVSVRTGVAVQHYEENCNG